MTKYTREQLIDALCAEHEKYEHDGVEVEPVEEYRSELETLTLEQLIEETSTGEKVLTLDDYMSVLL